MRCPGASSRRTPVSGGKIKINKTDLTASRQLCYSHFYNGMCAVCPNGDFEVTLEKIGEPEDFKWLDKVLEMALVAIECKVIKKTRTHGDCCLDHKDMIIVEIIAEAFPTSVIDKTTGRQVYDMIMQASNETGVLHEVVHVKFRRYDAQKFDMKIAMKKA